MRPNHDTTAWKPPNWIAGAAGFVVTAGVAFLRRSDLGDPVRRYLLLLWTAGMLLLNFATVLKDEKRLRWFVVGLGLGLTVAGGVGFALLL
ncbi:MAG: hypothetical protein U0Q16_29585 [Bryobacteraceae bacterium]